MDREPEELRFLGFFGIIGEAHKIISSRRKLFSQITLALILPLTFIFLVNIEITNLFFSKINRNEMALEDTPRVDSGTQEKIPHRLSSEWTAFLLFEAAYLLIVLVFSLLSTSAVVYTVACVYTAKEMAFRKIMSVVPKVWKRLMITFLWNFSIQCLLLLGYITVSGLLIILCLRLSGSLTAGLVIFIIISFVYLAGVVYISVVWHLASVVSVLEDSYGITAMKKSRALIKGNAWTVSAILLLFNLSFAGIEILLRKLVVHCSELGARVVYGALIVPLLSMLILIGLVVQTVIYFVCKSYHHESIDKSSLADHLEVYLGEYESLKGRHLQLEQYHV